MGNALNSTTLNELNSFNSNDLDVLRLEALSFDLQNSYNALFDGNNSLYFAGRVFSFNNRITSDFLMASNATQLQLNVFNNNLSANFNVNNTYNTNHIFNLNNTIYSYFSGNNTYSKSKIFVLNNDLGVNFEVRNSSTKLKIKTLFNNIISDFALYNQYNYFVKSKAIYLENNIEYEFYFDSSIELSHYIQYLKDTYDFDLYLAQQINIDGRLDKRVLN